MTPAEDFEKFRTEIEAAERRVAREIEPGPRALVVAVLVFVLLITFVLPHTGSARAVDVLFNTGSADDVAISLMSRIYCWMTLIFAIGFSMLALLTRRWGIAWLALAGSCLSVVAGMLAIWSRQTVIGDYPGPGYGLVIGWIAVIVLAFHWARVVWTRTAVQMAAEAERRQEAAQRQSRNLLEELSPEPGEGQEPGDSRKPGDSGAPEAGTAEPDGPEAPGTAKTD